MMLSTECRHEHTIAALNSTNHGETPCSGEKDVRSTKDRPTGSNMEAKIRGGNARLGQKLSSSHVPVAIGAHLSNTCQQTNECPRRNVAVGAKGEVKLRVPEE